MLVGPWLKKGKIEKNTIFGRALVRIRAKIEKTLFLVGLLLNIEKTTPFVVRLSVGLGQK